MAVLPEQNAEVVVMVEGQPAPEHENDDDTELDTDIAVTRYVEAVKEFVCWEGKVRSNSKGKATIQGWRDLQIPAQSGLNAASARPEASGRSWFCSRLLPWMSLPRNLDCLPCFVGQPSAQSRPSLRVRAPRAWERLIVPKYTTPQISLLLDP